MTAAADHDVAPRAATHYAGLDALRFVAAAMVVLFHFGFLYRINAPGFTRPWPELAGVARYGHLGVQLFFFISGFLILQTAGGRTWRQFMRARCVRLYPAYIACCLLTFAVVRAWSPVPMGIDTLLYNLTMQNGLVDRWVGRTSAFVDGSYWTLAFEWQFYFGMAILLALAQLERVEAWLWAWLIATAVDAFLPLRVLQVAILSPWSAYFIAGAAVYLLRSRGVAPARVALALGALALCALHTARLTAELAAIHNTIFSRAVSVGVVVAGFAAFAYATRGRARSTGWGIRALALAGALSYPLYLLHARLGEVAVARLWTPEGRWGLLAALSGGVLALAYAVHAAVERPLWRAFRGRVRERLETRG